MAAPDRPTIVVHLGDGVTQAHMAEVFYGMEEEGIPFRVVQNSLTNPAKLAHAAAIESRLGVGVGAHGRTIVVTTEKLPAEHPYITQNLNARRELDRCVGANAARLVKRIPLREMSNS